MVRLATNQTTFASGVLDPSLRGQVDLKAYAQGCKQGINVQRRSTGGLERRPGTSMLNALAANVRARLEPFEFASDQRYLVAFRDGTVDIYSTTGTLLQSTGGQPWNAAMALTLTVTQLGDVMIICDAGFWPRVLRRTSLTTFSIGLLTFESSSNGELTYQPYYKFEDPSITMTPSVATGSGTLTAKDASGSAYAFFSASHIGARFRIYDVEVVIDSLSSSSVANITVKGELKAALDLDPFKTEKGTNDVIVTHLFHGLKTGASITFTGCNDCGSIPGSYFDGAHSITVIDEHHYKITLSGVSYPYWEDLDQNGTATTSTYTSARLSEDGGGPNVRFSVAGVATRRWLEPSISAVRGYPAACGIHEMRLVLAGTGSQPDAVFMSNSLQFFRFDAGKGYDSDSVQVAVGVEDVSRIRHVVSNGDLQVFTPTSEIAFQVRQGEAITPNNARTKVFTRSGCSTAAPVPFDGASLFVQENGLTIYEYVWSDSQGTYLATPVSTLASHLINAPVQIAATAGMTARAEQFAFVVNADGTVAVFHSLRNENIAGWVIWGIANFFVETVCCLGTDVYFAGLHSNGSRYLYKLDNAVYFDGCVAVTQASSASGTTPATHRSRTLAIRIVANSNPLGLGYVGVYPIDAGGGFGQSYAFTQYVVGDPYYALVETLPPSLALPAGERKGMIKRLVRSFVDFQTAAYPTVDGVTLTFSDGGVPVDSYDGPYEMYHMGYEREPTLTISQSASFGPWRVLSVNQEVDVR